MFLVAEIHSQVAQCTDAFHLRFANHPQCVLQDVYGGKKTLFRDSGLEFVWD